MDYPIFNCIQTFINELGECYSEVNEPLALYKHLLSKTTINHTKAVEKHINIFREFCIENRIAIEKNDEEVFKQPLIKYSDKVYVDISDIFKIADNNDKDIIWKHLLVLSAYLDKDSISKDILTADSKKESESSMDNTKENNFISNMIDDITKKIDLPEDKDNLNIGDVMQKMISSGAVNDIFTTVQTEMASGNLDLNSLLSSAQNLMNAESPEGGPDMNNLVNDVMSSLTGGNAEGGADMMGMMMNMMGNLQPPKNN